ncbi:uncharacterized protein LOC127865604 isoform X2 [Dreissena polymorpha]|uniref:uncharacterized protein LOC127865604 isoform X2 n=1 Tax=Dreissena polymorpha TaxID=45954 RepID=UPI002263B2EA|nr:uncharacterized protein LOC127865604 isoform X2 [Dreissena polymorpha]
MSDATGYSSDTNDELSPHNSGTYSLVEDRSSITQSGDRSLDVVYTTEETAQNGYSTGSSFVEPCDLEEDGGRRVCRGNCRAENNSSIIGIAIHLPIIFAADAKVPTPNLVYPVLNHVDINMVSSNEQGIAEFVEELPTPNTTME